MFKTFLLALSLLNPHHQHPKRVQQEPQQQGQIDEMTRMAAGHVMGIRQATKQIEESCPYIPEVYFDAIHRSLDKIALDKDAAAPSFRQDFDNLEDDFHSLIFAATYYEKMDNI